MVSRDTAVYVDVENLVVALRTMFPELPPTFKLPPIPTPPRITNAPVEVDVLVLRLVNKTGIVTVPVNAPYGPLGPVAPRLPIPAAPAGPCGPCTPLGPDAPEGPPLGPCGPCGP